MNIRVHLLVMYLVIGKMENVYKLINVLILKLLKDVEIQNSNKS